MYGVLGHYHAHYDSTDERDFNTSTCCRKNITNCSLCRWVETVMSNPLDFFRETWFILYWNESESSMKMLCFIWLNLYLTARNRDIAANVFKRTHCNHLKIYTSCGDHRLHKSCYHQSGSSHMYIRVPVSCVVGTWQYYITSMTSSAVERQLFLLRMKKISIGR